MVTGLSTPKQPVFSIVQAGWQPSLSARPPCGTKPKSIWGFLILLGCCLIVSACSPSVPKVAQPDPTIQKLKKIGLAYTRAAGRLQHPPANLEEILPYLERFGKPADILVSDNDKQEFVIVWNVEVKADKLPEGSFPVVAFEKVGKDGKRQVLLGRSEIVLMTETELRAAVLPPGYALPF